jgi:hypothetical protein
VKKHRRNTGSPVRLPRASEDVHDRSVAVEQVPLTVYPDRRPPGKPAMMASAMDRREQRADQAAPQITLGEGR